VSRGLVIIVNAVIWGAVIVGCSLALSNTGTYPRIQMILAGGATASLFLVGLTVKGNKQDSR
jgi:hypothetical protein